jgi:hypothetical protein
VVRKSGVTAFFHENTTWIEHLIIQDDNFGPYFFFPFKKLPDIISCMIVPVPSPLIKVLPHEAANFAVRKTLYNQEFGEFLSEYLKNTPLATFNVDWYNEFIRHLKPVCGDGLVLRAILRKGCDIIEAYQQHEFAAIPRVLLQDSGSHYYWMVELSWPDIYCFGQSQSGVILVDAETAEISMVHIPGVFIAFSEGKAYVSVAEKEDFLRPHHKPGSIM